MECLHFGAPQQAFRTALRFVARVFCPQFYDSFRAIVVRFALVICVWPGCGMARADRIFFSQVGQPVLSDPSDPSSPTIAPSPLTVGSVPHLYGQVGQEFGLHVWLHVDDIPPSRTYYFLALDVVASKAGSVSATPFSWINPINPAVETPRWDWTYGGTLGAAGSAAIISEVTSRNFYSAGIGKLSGADRVFRSDPARDLTTGAFYLGQLTVQSQSPGSTGLYFRNGQYLTMLALRDDLVPANLQYGGNTVVPPYRGNKAGAGDPITNDLALADAIITTCLGPPPQMPTITLNQFASNPRAGDIVISGNAPGYFHVAENRWSGRIQITNLRPDADGNLTLHFDLLADEKAARLVERLNAASNRDYLAVLSSFSGPNVDTGGISRADIAVTFFGRGVVGANYSIEFNFLESDGCSPASETYEVAAVGVPEPSAQQLCLAMVAAFGVCVITSRRSSGVLGRSD